MDILLATILSCEEAKGIIDKIKPSAENRTELIEVLVQSTEKKCEWDAQVDWRNGFNPPYLWRKPMAKVTYRGVEYDTEEYTQKILDEAAQRKNHDLMYRGLKVTRKMVSA